MLLISWILKDQYPNKQFTISSLASNKPSDAGSDNNRESSIDLFWIKLIDFLSFNLILFERFGSTTVPTAIPAIASLIW